MIFNMNEDYLNKKSGIYTTREIHQQPATWEKTYNQIVELKDEIKEFIDKVIKCDDFDVILTGAGTSEFVGNSLFSYLNKKLNYKVKSYATTDITASPENYISKDKPTLLISFGRSGNSPESIGALDSAEAVSDNIYHLFVTCNKNGALSKRALNNKKCLAINLTDETHDQSFAMTSSFTNMYLAVLLVFNIDNIKEIKNEISVIMTNATVLVNERFDYFKKVVDEYDFDRIVYLGSNTLKGIAQESALKMLELTAGKVVTMYDTPLGFRHGPKSIVDDKTLTVIFLSDFEYTRKYEIDLLKEMSLQRKGNKILVISNKKYDGVNNLADFYYTFDSSYLDNVFVGLDYIVCAQLIALFKSLSLDITPDNPCPTGEVNRVVKGVTLYPYERG
ncbi:MAG: SIS domain-containing protein [Erysipelotrichaceae bacterium]|nr:SIS domain-containing protein [Erysipelotrichaceae bacterium]